MKPHFLSFAFALMITGITCFNAAAQDFTKSTFSEITGKKLIEYGWDVPQADYVLAHQSEMQELPFEGLIFQLKDRGNVFLVKQPYPGLSAEQEQLLRNLKTQWTKFTDNFIGMYAQSDMDWQSDADWKQITTHVSAYAKAARLSGCVGLLFDPEPYGFNPWNYAQQKHADKISIEEYSKKVQQRGRQFMRAMTKEYPDIKLLMFFQYHLFYSQAHQPDPALRKAALQKMESWNLLLPFLNGMLEEAKKNVQLIDGNEPSYYYKTAEDFFHAYWAMHQGAKINVPDALKQKYDTNVSAASALYMDYVFDRQGIGYNAASGMTDEERAKWFEHNVYYALKTTDEYAWLYSERMNWWKHENWPPGIQQAIISAKEKLLQGEELGFDLKSTFITAQNRLSKLLASRLLRRSARIPSIDTTAIPTIDGKLNEKIYSEVPWMDPFVTLISPKETQQAPIETKAWMAYDDENLYIALRCNEPAMNELKIFDAPRDGSIWNGENVDFSLLKPGQAPDDASAEYYHFILNPSNIQWDSIEANKQSNTAFDGIWKSATTRDANGWNAEIALSWKSIGIDEIKKGMELHGNIARFRVNGHNTELSSWSQFIGGFQEPQNFGTWILE